MATKKPKKLKKSDYARIVDCCHQALEGTDFAHLRVHSVTLVPRTARAASSDPPVCVPTGDGGIHCYTP